MRVLVCGGRGYGDDAHLYGELDRIHARTPITCIIEGGAPGADRLAAQWAAKRGVGHLRFEANWKAHGRAAGPIRNQKMLDDGQPDLVAALPGGKGTANMIRKAESAGIDVVRI